MDSGILPAKEITSLTDRYDLFIFDLWGVLIEGDVLYEGVVDKVNEIIASGKEVCFLSNAPRPEKSSYERIKSWGIKASPGRVFTSGELAREYIINSEDKLNIKKPLLYHLGADRNDEITQGFEDFLTEDLEKADIVLLSIYRDLGEDLSAQDPILKRMAGSGAKILCANPDTIIPRLGSVRYNAGYFAEKIEKFGGKVIYTGKPGSEIYKRLFDKFPLDPKRTLMVGDTLETDILGASKMGMDSALVTTGNAKKFHEKYEGPEKYKMISQAVRVAGIIPSFIGIL